MKHLLRLFTLLAAFFIGCLPTTAHAAIYRVNNTPGLYTYDQPAAPPLSDPNRTKYVYKSVRIARDAAAGGDTLYIEPSATQYDSLNLKKRLTLVGNGYFLTENAGLQANTLPSRFDVITFSAGSEGSKITGLTFTYGVGVYTNYIIIERNYFPLVGDYTAFAGNYQVELCANVHHVYVIQNYVKNGHIYSRNATTNASFIYILNNFAGNIKFQGDDSDIYVINNVFESPNGYAFALGVSNAVFQNNILTGYFGSVAVTASLVQHNLLCNYAFLPASDGNQNNVDMSNVFDAAYPSTDGKFRLKTGSPALDAGVGGVDCGMFDTPVTLPPGYTVPAGPDVPAGFTVALVPYQLSGIPAVPSIYQLNATSSGNNLNVTIGTRSNN